MKPPIERRGRSRDLSGEAGGLSTEIISAGAPNREEVRRFRLVVVEGPAEGTVFESTGDRCSLGSHASNDVVLDDPAVSRFHCEVLVGGEGARVRDLDSKNGTVLDGVRVKDATPRSGSLITLGRSVVRLELEQKTARLPVSTQREFGTLIGDSVAMRTAFALLERAAASDATVLLEGETGTGKEEAARSLHQAGARAGGPFVVIDCGAIPATLIESELFGHERGAFTGAVERQAGAFESAHGGTIFLDEIGELPLDLQPKLLRVLEQRELRRLGSHAPIKVDVRVIAATNRDLRAEVNARRFRSDLYFRLAVVKVLLPSLRERREDIAPLVTHILDSLGATEADAHTLVTPAFLATLTANVWTGNVRELRNYLERCLVFREAVPMEGARPGETGTPAVVDPTVPYPDARTRVLDDFDRRYVAALLELHGGNVSAAARAAGIGRVSLYKLMNRHGLK